MNRFGERTAHLYGELSYSFDKMAAILYIVNMAALTVLFENISFFSIPSIIFICSFKHIQMTPTLVASIESYLTSNVSLRNFLSLQMNIVGSLRRKCSQQCAGCFYLVIILGQCREENCSDNILSCNTLNWFSLRNIMTRWANWPVNLADDRDMEKRKMMG